MFSLVPLPPALVGAIGHGGSGDDGAPSVPPVAGRRRERQGQYRPPALSACQARWLRRRGRGRPLGHRRHRGTQWRTSARSEHQGSHFVMTGTAASGGPGTAAKLADLAASGVRAGCLSALGADTDAEQLRRLLEPLFAAALHDAPQHALGATREGGGGDSGASTWAEASAATLRRRMRAARAARRNTAAVDDKMPHNTGTPDNATSTSGSETERRIVADLRQRRASLKLAKVPWSARRDDKEVTRLTEDLKREKQRPAATATSEEDRKGTAMASSIASCCSTTDTAQPQAEELAEGTDTKDADDKNDTFFLYEVRAVATTLGGQPVAEVAKQAGGTAASQEAAAEHDTKDADGKNDHFK
jgi:hypothetical protein